MKKNLDSYSGKFSKAIELSKEGNTVKQISMILNVPYQTVYSWIKRGRRKTQSERFFEFVKASGPVTLDNAKKQFPKHSDIFLKAVSRGYDIKKYDSGLKPPFRYWYYVSGQEDVLRMKISGIRSAVSEAKERIKDRI